MSYTAVVLTQVSQTKLRNAFQIPPGWEIICHHMTINMGEAKEGPAGKYLGQLAELKVKTIAKDDLVMAVGVETDIPSQNEIKHITIAVNRKDGGKPYLSNNLKNWEPAPEITLEGHVKVV